jgi:hypothetical protein
MALGELDGRFSTDSFSQQWDMVEAEGENR